jgi:RNA polymerase sigma-70 factor, ECF subfamily
MSALPDGAAGARLRCIELAFGRHQDDERAFGLAMRLVALLEWPSEHFRGPPKEIGKPEEAAFDAAPKRAVETPPPRRPYRKRGSDEPRARFPAHTRLDPERVMALPSDNAAIVDRVLAAARDLANRRGVRRRAIMQKTGLHAPQVTEALRRLKQQGFIYSTGERAGTRWFVKGAPAAEAAPEPAPRPAPRPAEGARPPFRPANVGAGVADVMPHLRRYAWSLTRNRDRADDLVQDTVERMLAKAELYREGSNLRAWGFTMMRNIFINGKRHDAVASRHEQYLMRTDALHVQPPNQFEAALLQEVAREIAGLSQEEREAVLLLGAEQRSHRELADETGLPIGTMKSRLSRGRAKLRGPE